MQVMKSRKLPKIYKSNDMNQANFKDFGLSTYRVFLNLISKLQRHDVEGNPIPRNAVDINCTLSANEYSKEFKIPVTHAYQILKSAVDSLLKTHFTVPIGKSLLKINICSKALYVESEGYITISFTQDIMSHLVALQNQFTIYNLCEIAGFKSIYTTRFYELLMQWKTTGLLDISVKDLRHAIGCVDVYKLYNDFKRYAFGHAVDEINSQYAIMLNYKELKEGKAVNRLIFTFKRTEIHQTYDIVKQKIRNQYVRPKRTKII